MKSMNKRSGPTMLFSIFILMSLLCFSAGNLMAQQGTPTQGQPVYNWKPVADGRAALILQITNLNQQMPGFTEGTPLYENALRRVAYFKAIVYEIDRGETLDKSLENALPAAATVGYTKEGSYTSRVVLRALMEEARSMLTN
jgi:hypothetical protein